MNKLGMFLTLIRDPLPMAVIPDSPIWEEVARLAECYRSLAGKLI